MLDRRAMRELMARRLDGTVGGWCAEHGIDEAALELVVRTYCHDDDSAAAVVVAFRLGFESAESRTVRGVPAMRYEDPR